MIIATRRQDTCSVFWPDTKVLPSSRPSTREKDEKHFSLSVCHCFKIISFGQSLAFFVLLLFLDETTTSNDPSTCLMWVDTEIRSMSCFEDEFFLSPQRTYNYRARLEMVSVDKTHTRCIPTDSSRSSSVFLSVVNRALNVFSSCQAWSVNRSSCRRLWERNKLVELKFLFVLSRRNRCQINLNQRHRFDVLRQKERERD